MGHAGPSAGNSPRPGPMLQPGPVRSHPGQHPGQPACVTALVPQDPHPLGLHALPCCVTLFLPRRFKGPGLVEARAEAAEGLRKVRSGPPTEANPFFPPLTCPGGTGGVRGHSPSCKARAEQGQWLATEGTHR